MTPERKQIAFDSTHLVQNMLLLKKISIHFQQLVFFVLLRRTSQNLSLNFALSHNPRQ